MLEQLSLLAYFKEPPKFQEAEWLRAQGFTNWYDRQPPVPGMYEWRDIEIPTKGKVLEYTTGGGIYLGRLAMGRFRPTWWRPIEGSGNGRTDINT